MNTPIVITGFMGCGKTEVSQSLATHLGRTALDLDQIITTREGKSPARLIEEDGETLFRTLETSALELTLRDSGSAVIALGGGAWIQEINRNLIARFEATSVWLDTPFEVCWQRIEASKEPRPLGKTREQALQLYETRLPIYRLAQLHVEYSAAESANELACRISRQLGFKQ